VAINIRSHVPIRLVVDCDSISEIQANAICRSFPSIRIASLRFHHVCLPHQAVQRSTYRDFWSWTDLDAAARACWLGVAVEGSGFETGHEAFFILSPRLNIGNETGEVLHDAKEKEEQERIYHKLRDIDLNTIGTHELVEVVYPGVTIKEGWLKDAHDRRGLFDVSKAEALLGWKHDV
jgi:nucleoside-diphosphate-sugar epimerase